MSHTRTIYFFILAAIFLIVAPVITFYTAGYNYQWKKKQLERLGVLEINTNPTKAGVLLNNRYVGETPLFQRLVPGHYELTVQNDGYISLFDAVDIKSGLATIKNFTLWKDVQPRFLTALDSSGQFAPNAQWLTTRRNVNGQQEGWISSRDGQKSWRACSVASANAWQSRWNSTSNAVLFLNERANQTACLGLINGLSLNLNRWFTTTITDIRWAPYDSSLLLVTAGSRQYIFNWKRRQVTAFSNITGASLILGPQIYWLENTTAATILKTRSAKNTTLINFVTLPKSTYHFLEVPGNFVAIGDTNDRVRVYDAANLNLLGACSAKQIVFSGDKTGRQFLCQNDFEVSLFDSRRQTHQTIIRSTTPLRALKWLSTNQYLLVAYPTELRAIAIDNPYRDNVLLARLDAVDDFWLNRANDFLYILGQIKNQRGLFELNLSN